MHEENRRSDLAPRPHGDEPVQLGWGWEVTLHSRRARLPAAERGSVQGMKGQISEFELGVLRARMHDARSSKAARGELRIGVPVGYIWDRDIGLSLDPDLRVQEAVRQIFARFALWAAHDRRSWR